MEYKGNTNEYLELLTIDKSNHQQLKEIPEGALLLFWFVDDNNQINIDTKDYVFDRNTIICLTELNHFNIKSISKANVIIFNAPFYCLNNHDSSVGCKGILFFGSSSFPTINLLEKDIYLMKMVWQVFIFEIEQKDDLQLEMLQMLLKRILILCIRVYKSHQNFNNLKSNQKDIIREFNFLVESHFREKHTVAAYANLLNKSPKTLSNLFGKISSKTPLQIIQNRILLEVKRMLSYTTKPISEIGYDVGFKDIQTFSRFFKTNEGISPKEFRNLHLN